MGQPDVVVPQAQRTHSSSRASKGPVAIALAVLLWNLWYIFGFRNAHDGRDGLVEPANNTNERFTDWDLIKPSEELDWVPCFRQVDEFLCARLTVPLDYNRPLNGSSANPAVHIALLLLPGRNHTDSGAWSESPMLVNPGGPGGSGTGVVMAVGRALQTIAGSDRDVLGFDPRGIGATTPHADCFSQGNGDGTGDGGSLMRRMLWQIGAMTDGLANTSSKATEQVVLRAHGLTALCGTQDGEDSILRYAGTPNVAQDMLSIVEAWERWTSKLDSDRARRDTSLELRSPAEEPSPLSTRGKLVYWGFSYGTILGATFATMFPDKVGRLVLDGVVDSDEWYFGNYWTNAIEDTDKVVEKFQLYCHVAEERCQLYRRGDTVEDVKARYESILADLAEKPRVYAIKGNTPFVVTYSGVRLAIFMAAYQPVTFLPIIAMILDALYRDLDMGKFMPPADMVPLCGMSPRDMMYPSEGQVAVLCSDQRGLVINETRAGLDDLLRQMAQAGSFGPCTFMIATSCAGWDIKPVDPPSMHWDSFPLANGGPINTSFPLVFVSNSRDPITPLSSGLRQVQRFADAGFIEQISEGHCSISSVSICTLKQIQGYFSHGVVPEKPVFDNPDGGSLAGTWTECEVDQRPFDVPGSWPKRDHLYTAAEMDVLRAGKDVQRAMANWHMDLPSVSHPFKHLFQMDEDEVARLLASS